VAKRRSGIRRKLQVEWYGDDFLDIVHKHGDAALFAAGQIVLAAAGRRAPRRSGKLASSGYVSTATQSSFRQRKYWRKEKKPPIDGATVGFSAPHAHLIESGRRRAGKIAPSKRRQRMRTGNLALRIGDRYVATSRFKRLSSRPFLGPALEETQETMVQELSKVLRSKLEQFLRFDR
jgi:hypothetical protein